MEYAELYLHHYRACRHPCPPGRTAGQGDQNYQSTVTVTKGDKSVNALKLMALMGMGIKCGDTVTVTVEGSDEDTTAPALKQFFETNL